MSLLASRTKLAHGGDIDCTDGADEVCGDLRNISHESRMLDRYQTTEMLSEAHRSHSTKVAPQYPGATMEVGLTTLHGALEHITAKKGDFIYTQFCPENLKDSF